jgi:hypothetical protein
MLFRNYSDINLNFYISIVEKICCVLAQKAQKRQTGVKGYG